MPKSSIERVIRSASISDHSSHSVHKRIRYEGYGHGKVGIIVETPTNNRNRTTSDIRTIFSKNG